MLCTDKIVNQTMKSISTIIAAWSTMLAFAIDQSSPLDLQHMKRSTPSLLCWANCGNRELPCLEFSLPVYLVVELMKRALIVGRSWHCIDMEYIQWL